MKEETEGSITDSTKVCSQIVELDFISKGQRLFGRDEKDAQSSANFLILILSCIERWSQLESNESEKENEPSQYSFRKVHQNLQNMKIKFPSAYKQSSAAGRKTPKSSNDGAVK